MKIERCPFCGSSDENIGRTSESVIRFWVHCRTCYYDGPAKATVEQAIDAHNRLSRIVRAAEEWAVADAGYRTDGGCMEWADRLTDARRELRRAVEGGRAE